MTPPLRDRAGWFYAIDLEPGAERHRVKMGWADDVMHRLREHRRQRAAPFATLIKSWPCVKGWEYPALRHARLIPNEPVGKETSIYADLVSLSTHMDGFFSSADRCENAPMPARPSPTAPKHGMQTVGEISKAFGIPQSTVYYLVRIGKIPAHDVTQSWHKQRRLQFKLSEVRAALDAMRPLHPATD